MSLVTGHDRFIRGGSKSIGQLCPLPRSVPSASWVIQTGDPVQEPPFGNPVIRIPEGRCRGRRKAANHPSPSKLAILAILASFPASGKPAIPRMPRDARTAAARLRAATRQFAQRRLCGSARYGAARRLRRAVGQAPALPSTRGSRTRRPGYPCGSRPRSARRTCGSPAAVRSRESRLSHRSAAPRG